MITMGLGEGMGLILQGLIGWIEGIIGAIGGIGRRHIPTQVDFVPTQRGMSFRPTSPKVSFVTRRR